MFGQTEIEAHMWTTDLWRKSSLMKAWMSILLVGSLLAVHGQEKPSTAGAVPEVAALPAIEIPDEPKRIDPATLVPPMVAVHITVKFDGVPLKTVFKWLQEDQMINLQIDYKALADAKILDTEPVHEQLADSPLYLLLNRREALGIAWYVRDNSLLITSLPEYQKVDRTLSYNLGDFFDAGYPSEELVLTITRCCSGRRDGGMQTIETGSILLLGDVAFIRQSDSTHLEIAALLMALRKHGRRTFTLDEPRHSQIREAMDTKVAVDFQETPLIFAVQTLAEQAGIDIRLDRTALSKSPVRERTPVTLKLTDQKLIAVLRSMLSNLNLSLYLRDEVLWVTTKEAANRFRKSAVYDVRDLCRDQVESQALKDAIRKQTRADWRTTDEAGGAMETPLPGILVVRHTEATLDEVFQLLENYRMALRASKVRKAPTIDPTEVVTGYYRLPRPMAKDLKSKLPQLIQPATWRTNEFPDAPGTIDEISIDARGVISDIPANPPGSNAVLSENQVLIIRQTRAAHRLIGKLIQTLTESSKVDAEAASDRAPKPQVRPIDFGSRLLHAQ